MDGYTHQAKATKKFGITFRSKLEAQWAYFFDSCGDDWNYVDSPWHDFVVSGLLVEVKPNSKSLFDIALHRAIENGWTDRLIIAMGAPDCDYDVTSSSEVAICDYDGTEINGILIGSSRVLIHWCYGFKSDQRFSDQISGYCVNNTCFVWHDGHFGESENYVLGRHFHDEKAMGRFMKEQGL
jgi:hypothetical protein